MRKFLSLIALVLALCISFSACTIWDIPDMPDVPGNPDTPSTPDDADEPDDPTVPDADEAEEKYQKFLEVLEVYEQNHLSESSKEQILLDTIKNLLIMDPDRFDELMYALAKSEDVFSYYYTADDYYAYEHDKEYSGIGVTVRFFEGYTVCQYVNPDGPAAKAGVKNGDIIYSVDGDFVAKYESDPLVSRIKGQTGTDVEIGFYRPSDKQVHFLTVTRGDIYTPTVKWEYKTQDGKTFAVVTVDDFSGIKTLYEFAEFVDDANSKNVEDVIIDLRNNPGGNLDVCLDFINLCIPEKDKVICSIAGRGGEIRQTYKTTGYGNKFDNLVILVNQVSASAAELFPKVLQEYGLATVIGTQTYGKAVGQSHYPLSNGDIISLTSFELVTPNGVRYHGVGVFPDIVVENPPLEVPVYELLELTEDNYTQAVLSAENEAVNALRQRLILTGFDVTETGAYDSKLQNAVKGFQKMMKLSQTGQLDKATYTQLTQLVSVIVCIGEEVDNQMSAAVNEILGK